MGFGVPVETRSVGQNGATRKHGDSTIGLLGRSEDPEGPLTAGDGEALALELVNDVVGPRVWRGGVNGDAHVFRSDGELSSEDVEKLCEEYWEEEESLSSYLKFGLSLMPSNIRSASPDCCS